MNRTLVVLGHGMVGHRLVEEVRRRDPGGRWRVIALTDDSRTAYDRVILSSYLTGENTHDIELVRPQLRTDPLVEFRTRTRAELIDPGARVVRCADGTEIGYDALVLATGSRPFVPPVPGRELDGCFVYRTLDDLEAIRAAAVPGAAGVVVGGGLLGLEAANALRYLRMRPHVVELAPHLMPMQIDAAGGAVLGGLVAALGVRVHCGAMMRSADAGADGRVCGVTLDGGERIDAPLVIFAAGVRPRDELAEAAGLRRGERGGILVDERCRTGVPGIWAIGECAAVEGRTYGLVAPGYRMADTVAEQLTGGADAGAPLPALDTSTKLKALGIDVASFGDAHATTPGALELAHTDVESGTYTKLVLSDDVRVLLGGILVGDASRYGVLSALVGRELPAEPERLLGVG